jgi:hypothetical protein
MDWVVDSGAWSRGFLLSHIERIFHVKYWCLIFFLLLLLFCLVLNFSGCLLNCTGDWRNNSAF